MDNGYRHRDLDPRCVHGCWGATAPGSHNRAGRHMCVHTHSHIHFFLSPSTYTESHKCTPTLPNCPGSPGPQRSSWCPPFHISHSPAQMQLHQGLSQSIGCWGSLVAQVLGGGQEGCSWSPEMGVGSFTLVTPAASGGFCLDLSRRPLCHPTETGTLLYTCCVRCHRGR